MVSEPISRVVPEALANELEVVIQTYCYVGIAVKHANAIQQVSGAAYPAAPSFA